MAGANIRIGVTSSEFQKQMKEVNSQLKLMQSECALATSKASAFGNKTDQLVAKQNSLKSIINSQNQTIRLYQDRIANINNTIETQKNKQVQLAEKIKEVTQKYKDSCVQTGKNSSESKALESELKKLNEEYKNNDKTLQSNNQELNNLKIKLNNTKASLVDNEKALKDLDSQLKTVKWDEFGEKAQKVGKKLSEVGKTMSTAITAPILGIAGASAKTAISFEAAMSNVEAISRATGDELKSLEDKAKEMGEKTSKSAKESADALGYMALAGWDTQQMLEGLEPVLRASEAGNIDLATCSDLVTDSMSSLSLQVSDLGKYLDVVAMTQNSANSTMQGMLEAYNEVGGTFSNLNVSLEEGATWLGVLANRSLKGSEAGNSLNSLLVNLTGGSSTAANAMQELGVSAWDANGNFKGIEETLRTLQGALANCTQEQKTNFESAIGGKTQLTTLQKMLSGLGTEYGSLKQEITNCDGALIRTAETMQNNTQGNITKFKSKLESVANSIGEILLPTINNFLDKVTVVLNWFGNLDDKTKKIIVTIGGVAAAIGPALLVAGKVAFSINSIVEATSKLSNVFNGAKLTTMFNPWVLGATAAIGVGILIYKNWDKIKEMAGKLTDYLSEKFNAIKEMVTKVFDNVKNSIKEKMDSIKATIKEKIETIKTTVSEKVEFIKNIFVEKFEAAKKKTLEIFETTKNIVKVTLMTIGSVIEGATKIITLPFTFIWENCKDVVVEKLNSVKEIVSEKFNTIKDFVSEKLNAVNNFVSERLEKVRNYFSEKLEGAKNVVLDKFNAIKNYVQERISSVFNIVSEKMESVKNAISEKMESMKSIVSEKIGAIKNFFSEKLGPIKDTVSEKFNIVKDTISNAMSTAGKYVAEKLSHMKSAYEENGGGIKGIVASTMEGIKQYYSVEYDAINNLTGGKLEKVVNVISEKFNVVKEDMSNIMSSIGNKVSEILESIKNKFLNIMESVKDIVGRAINKVKDLFNFNWSLPKIKLPHFKITGEFNLNPPEVPHLGVDWYSMGAIFTKPTILGGVGVGDANNGRGSNAEAVIPLNSMYDNIRGIMREELSLLGQTIEAFRKITSTPAKTQPIDINITLQSDVNMDGRKVGDMVTNRIVENISRIQNSRNIATRGVTVRVK